MLPQPSRIAAKLGDVPNRASFPGRRMALEEE
jgi:hypothetical protein